MFYCSMFPDSWDELKLFIETCPAVAFTPEWIMFFIIVPVNEIVSQAILAFPKKERGANLSNGKSKMTHFLTNRLLKEYLNGVMTNAGKETDFLLDDAFTTKHQADVQAFVDLMKLKMTKSAKFEGREVDSMQKIVCLLYVYYMKDCELKTMDLYSHL